MKKLLLTLSMILGLNTSALMAELTQTQMYATLGIVTNFILDDSTISHNGTSYGEVTSPYTGRVWLDRNLGADRVCTSFDDTQCYGDYYQWGRNYDGHQNSNSFDYATLANDVTNVGHGDFITTSTSPDDWASVDVNGTTRFLNWSATDGSSVCPVGFRVPTITELRTETLDNGVTTRDTAFTNFLKLPSSGGRDNYDGSLYYVGSWGLVWSSSASGSKASGLLFNFGDAHSYNGGYRASGRSIRCIKAQTHKHNGTTYGEVISPYTGKVWLDRNLGAKRVCTSFDDAECYGDYYQWGRNADGHQVSTSSTTSALASDIYNVGHGNFITNGTSIYDWASVDLAGAGRNANWSATDGSSVCPVGFRVPTATELQAETTDNGVTNSTIAFSNYLKLPSAGGRGQLTGFMVGVGSWGDVWSSSASGSKASNLYFDSGSANLYSSGKRAFGLSVRCIKN